mmetsp:Transcript_1875/g.1476  ORF Transcript_1875/g.1476 Transcript_1875/m.1476 type:complete len:107 (-) Transcript_1875:287-607(-)
MVKKVKKARHATLEEQPPVAVINAGEQMHRSGPGKKLKRKADRSVDGTSDACAQEGAKTKKKKKNTVMPLRSGLRSHFGSRLVQASKLFHMTYIGNQRRDHPFAAS